jgi:hypothetical protein
VDEGWWEVKLCARDDERVEIILRGKLTKASSVSTSETQWEGSGLMCRRCTPNNHHS